MQKEKQFSGVLVSIFNLLAKSFGFIKESVQIFTKIGLELMPVGTNLAALSSQVVKTSNADIDVLLIKKFQSPFKIPA